MTAALGLGIRAAVFGGALQRLGLAGATGYIWFFFSERVFWSFWRAQDEFAASVATWVIYTVTAYAGLIAIRWYRVRTIWAVFLIGALFGWLIEGVFAMTLFGVDDMPFPLTISWTGLAWHALISVTFGWYALQIALRRGLLQALVLSGCLGAFWGLWSISWAAADASAAPSWPAFLAHAFAATLPLVTASLAYPMLRPAEFYPGWIDGTAAGVLIGAWFAGVTVVQVGPLAVAVIAPLLALVWWGLRRNRAVAPTGPDFLTVLATPVGVLRSLAVLAMPAVATLVYSICQAAGFIHATNIAVFAITAPAGLLGLVTSLVMVCRAPRRAGFVG